MDDLTGDGTPDLIVGDPEYDCVANFAFGRVSIFNGATGALITNMVGPGIGSRYGTAVCGLGDLNGDGLGDFAVGSAGHGAPVLVTDAVGLAPAVTETGAGRVVPRDVPAIADALRDLLATGRDAFADATRAFAARYTWDEAAARYEAMYRDVLAEAGRVPKS